MKLNGYPVVGSKSDYIDILVEHKNMDRKELEKKSFKEVVVEYCFYYKPIVLTNQKGA